MPIDEYCSSATALSWEAAMQCMQQVQELHVHLGHLPDPLSLVWGLGKNPNTFLYINPFNVSHISGGAILAA